VTGDPRWVEAEHVEHEPLEDGVGRHDETAEDEDERRGDEKASRQGERLALPPSPNDLAPRYVVNAQGDGPRRGEDPCQGSTQDVLRDTRVPQAPYANVS
jgi:hypothetical protein